MGKRGTPPSEEPAGGSETDSLRQQSFRVLLVLLAVSGWLSLQVGYFASPTSSCMWLGVSISQAGAKTAYLLGRCSFRLGGVWLMIVITLTLSCLALAFPQFPMRLFPGAAPPQPLTRPAIPHAIPHACPAPPCSVQVRASLQRQAEQLNEETAHVRQQAAWVRDARLAAREGRARASRGQPRVGAE